MEAFTKMGILPIAISIEMRFAKEMHVGQRVNVRTNVRNQGIRLIFNQQMLEDGQVVNEADTIYVAIDTINSTDKKVRPIRPPAELIAQLTGPQIKVVPYSKDTRWL